MKRLISLLLCIIITVLSSPLTVAATDDELRAKDMFYIDFQWTEGDVSSFLEKCKYTPVKNANPFGNIYYVCYRYVPRAGGDFDGFYTIEEVHEYYCKMMWIKQEYFDKYLVVDPTFATIIKDESGRIIEYGFVIIPTQTLIKETDTYDSYERAYFYANLYAHITSDMFHDSFRNECHFSEKLWLKEPDFSYGEILPFDANYDGSINSRDVLILKRAIAGHEVKCNYYTRDLNGDGVTNAKDMLYLNTFAKTGIDLRQ